MAWLGLAWLGDGDLHFSRFDEIAKVIIPGGHKRSTEIELLKSDGRLLILPVIGNDGLRFDSLEMVRFLDRVLTDIRVSEE